MGGCEGAHSAVSGAWARPGSGDLLRGPPGGVGLVNGKGAGPSPEGPNARVVVHKARLICVTPPPFLFGGGGGLLRRCCCIVDAVAPPNTAAVRCPVPWGHCPTPRQCVTAEPLDPTRMRLTVKVCRRGTRLLWRALVVWENWTAEGDWHSMLPNGTVVRWGPGFSRSHGAWSFGGRRVAGRGLAPSCPACAMVHRDLENGNDNWGQRPPRAGAGPG